METTTVRQLPKVIYTAKTHTTGGRERGISRSSDGNLDIKLSTPGTSGNGTNPEQLFAAGWSACFEGAMAITAAKLGLKLPAGTAIDAEVDLRSLQGEYSLGARLNISLPGLDNNTAQQIINGGHNICPYSKAIRGNVDVELNLIEN